MAYSLFWTDVQVSKQQYIANKPKLIKAVYNDLDDALGRAQQIINYGGIPWEIETDDGTTISRDEIAKMIRDRRFELTDRPRVH